MSNDAQKNLYDVLQVSQNATNEVIEKMFRFLATKHHPDAGGDKQRFNELVKAFETLRDSVARDNYDMQLKNEKRDLSRLLENSKQAGPDAAIRHELLCLFYARRRQHANAPALGAMAAEKALNLPEEVLEFHLWYFREKGWIKRWENGGFAITAEGVDQIDSHELNMSKQLRIESSSQFESNALVSA